MKLKEFGCPGEGKGASRPPYIRQWFIMLFKLDKLVKSDLALIRLRLKLKRLNKIHIDRNETNTTDRDRLLVQKYQSTGDTACVRSQFVLK